MGHRFSKRFYFFSMPFNHSYLFTQKEDGLGIRKMAASVVCVSMINASHVKRNKISINFVDCKIVCFDVKMSGTHTQYVCMCETNSKTTICHTQSNSEKLLFLSVHPSIHPSIHTA